MKRLAPALAIALLATLGLPAAAQAEFGLHDFQLRFAEGDGSPATQAGSHPFAVTTSFDLNTRNEPRFASAENPEGTIPDGEVKELRLSLPPGQIGSRTAVPQCTTAEFLSIIEPGGAGCPDATAVGAERIFVVSPEKEVAEPVYNLVPPPGVAAKFGFVAALIPIVIEVGVNGQAPNNLAVTLLNVPQAAWFYASTLQLWGVPAAHSHDPFRGSCLRHTGGSGEEFASQGICDTGAPEVPFLTLPRSCTGPPTTSFEAVSWQEPDAPPASGSFEAPAMIGCSRLAFSPSIAAQPTSLAANSPTGLDFSLNVNDEGIGNPVGLANSDLRKAAVTLPEGFSVNPSIAEGLEVCSKAELARETAFSEAGAGCPNASKIGSVEVESPLLPEGEAVRGALYQAKPYDNEAGNSLVGLYMVIKNPNLGIVLKQPLKVEPDPKTGQLTTVADELPQLPFSHFRLHFREGARSPLVTPPACGAYEAKAVLTPWAGGEPLTTTSAFQIITGPNSGPCPSGGLPPFHPELLAGTLNNAAGRFSPFNVRITRTDSEQEITHFSIKLPPGVAGKLAGIPFCTEAGIAQAESRTGPHGGAEELADPSCPAASQVGRSLAGSGVGPTLAYAPGKLYLAGPYHGSPVSFVAITAGVVGPFDIGTVVVRLAIDVNPETGEVFLDSTGSDPIPHIVKGILIHLRDIRAYTDRPQFTFNPTSCARKSTAATVLGSGLDFVSEADDNPFVSTSPFQAADCAALPFEPKLSLRLIGGTKRGTFPKLKAFLRMNGFGEAGVARARVTLPRSEFIANAHFDTICTRAQFKLQGGNGEACPAGSIYGWARAKSPILSDPVEGPIFLRSSEHELPDVVASLRGQEINVHLVGHVDSVKGQLRNTFETVPDAPVEWASFSFKGEKKGLFENSTDLCAGTHKAKVEFTGQNGKTANYGSALKVKCKGKAKRKHARHARVARRGRAAH